MLLLLRAVITSTHTSSTSELFSFAHSGVYPVVAICFNAQTKSVVSYKLASSPGKVLDVLATRVYVIQLYLSSDPMGITDASFKAVLEKWAPRCGIDLDGFIDREKASKV